MIILALFFQGEGSGFSIISFLPFILILAIFYFLVIVPQKRQQQSLRDLIADLKINDEIVTSGGVIGKIKEVRETSFIIQSADKTFLEIGKSAVIGRRTDEVAKK